MCMRLFNADNIPTICRAYCDFNMVGSHCKRSEINLRLLRFQYGRFTLQALRNKLFHYAGGKRNGDQEASNLASEGVPVWSEGKIISSHPACSSGKSQILKEYKVPGQFIQFRYKNEEPIFLAMSSPPNRPCLEFLIKMSPRLVWLNEALKEGQTIHLSSVLGKGFSLNAFDFGKVDNLVLAAAGSGIAPLKACIESGMLPNVAASKLYYGEWTPEDLCFSDLYMKWWTDFRVEVVPVLSRTDNSSGYIQDVLRQEALLSTIPHRGNTVALLCGMDDMIQSTTLILENAGIPKERVLLNV